MKPAPRAPASPGSTSASRPDVPSLAREGRLVAGHDRRWSILAVLVLSLVMVVTANTVLNVALPTLARDLAASDTQVQWIVDAYVQQPASGDRPERRAAAGEPGPDPDRAAALVGREHVGEATTSPA